jgi:hypothetical protein
MEDLDMKLFIQFMLFSVICVMGVQNSFSAQPDTQSTTPTVIVINGQHVEIKKASRTERLKELAQELGHDISNGVKAMVVGLSLWSAGRHYQMVKDSKNDWKALFTHKDSLAKWLVTEYRPLCLTFGVVSASYVGYKLYRYFANNNAEMPKAGMVDSETQTSLLV